jgi:sulfur carrier protein ThiS
MKIEIKLYGTLRERFPDYQPSRGMEVELPERAMAQDLLAHLEIDKSQRAVVIAEGRVLQAVDEIPDGVTVNVVQAIGGG